MGQLKDLFVDALRSAFGLARSTKDAYEGASRFARLRLFILVLLVVDVVAVFVFIGMFGARPIDIEVWFEKSFPSNMLIIRNESDDVMEKVRLTIDGRYVRTVLRLEPGPRGFEVSRDFADESELTPSDEYVPKVVIVELNGTTMKLDVSQKQQP